MLPVTPVTRVTPVTSCLFYVKNAFNNILYIIKLLYIPQFQKKHTLGNRSNRGNQGLRGLIKLLTQ